MKMRHSMHTLAPCSGVLICGQNRLFDGGHISLLRFIKSQGLSSDHRRCLTYLFFFSFFIFLFSLRLFCGAFLLSFTPLLFSFITSSSLQSFYVLVLPAYEKKWTTVPIFVLGLFQ